MINSRLTRWKSVFRTIYFAPVVTTLVAVAIVFKYLYHPRFGVLNRALGHLGVPPIDWLGNPRLAKFSLIIPAVWRGFRYPLLIFLPRLQKLPQHLYRA